jgi:hypothetical protein
MSEAWEEIGAGKKYWRHDGWQVVASVDGAIHVVPPDKSDARDEEGQVRRTFDSIAAAMDFADQHHPS